MEPEQRALSDLGPNIVVGWNDLGMHCMNQNYGDLCVLPPYNVVHAQVILRGPVPQLVQDGVKIDYMFPANTRSSNKVDFWTYAKGLFGADLAPDVGLTGNGLSGYMAWNPTFGLFEVTGIPLTPYDDATPTTLQPYQLATLTLRDNTTHARMDQTTIVVPVSVEMSCNKCHSASGRSTEYAILMKHEAVDLTTRRPVLCASCHASNALGTAGQPGVPSLSEAVHGHHAEESSATCYDCHPGKQTQCLRDVMFSAGIRCENCHGTLAQVAQSIQNGRRPWFDEPSCAQTGCHDANHAPEAGKLYRMSKGHGGVACEACHNSPHAILPTIQPRDSHQVMRLQGTGTGIRDCRVCHVSEPDGAGPHGVLTSWRIANHLTAKSPLTGDELTRADYDHDGKVSITDVVTQANRGL